jgi:replicative DNA helicase
MKNPQKLAEVDKYKIEIKDFPSTFEQYIYSTIYNLYTDGAKSISVVDVDTYLSSHPIAKKIFENGNGIEYLQDALDLSTEENFDAYYLRFKKLNCIDDLKNKGFDTSEIYCEDVGNPKYSKINEEFDKMSVEDIFDKIKGKFSKIEAQYATGEVSNGKTADKDIDKLLKSLSINPQAGPPLQGNIFNTICKGACPNKFYIRSASSGVGKTRQAVGDACFLAYPIRYSINEGKWIKSGSNKNVLFIATEQKITEIQTLILSYLSGINETEILFGRFDPKKQQIINETVQVMKYYSKNLIIVQLPDPNVSQIKAIVREYCLMYNIDAVFYDYIFSSPSLLSEYRDLKIREDVALSLLSNTLKELAVQMNVFVMTSTQTNVKGDEDKSMKNESVIRGSRAIIDKCDLACVVSKVTDEQKELLQPYIEKYGICPNQVTDIYKVRQGSYTNVKIWSYIDLGTCRKRDLFITDSRLRDVPNFSINDFEFIEEDDLAIETLLKLNSGEKIVNEKVEESSQNRINIENIEKKQLEKAGKFGDYISG